MQWHSGFAPVIDQKSKILILGSFPSVKSREQGFYYGNPQNRFWKMLCSVTEKQVPSDIDGKKEFLLKNGIALWDVIDKCAITGSSDGDINRQNSIPVDFSKIKALTPSLRLIICNGKKAYSIFKEFNPKCEIETVCLPSTSPANASFNLVAWTSVLKKYLTNV